MAFKNSCWCPRRSAVSARPLRFQWRRVVSDPQGLLHSRGALTCGGRRGRLRAGSGEQRCRRCVAGWRRSSRPGYKAGEQIFLALDVASRNSYSDGPLCLRGRQPITGAEIGRLSCEALVSRFRSCRSKTALRRGPTGGLGLLSHELGRPRCSWWATTCSVTNTTRPAAGHRRRGSPNSILIKVNQIGSLSRNPCKAIDLAGRAGLHSGISHRSGETEDTEESPTWP